MPQTNNTSLHFTQAGEGQPALVFLHYFGGSSESWSLVIDELKKTFRCIAIDLPGFGSSPAPASPCSVKEMAADADRLITDLQLKSYIVIGHSMGGKIALAFASQKPADLLSLVLVAPSPPTPEPMEDNARKDLINAFGNRPAIEKLIKKITAQPLSATLFEETTQDHLRVSKTAWNGWIEKGSREDISVQMSSVTLPVSVISGAADPNFSSEFLQKTFSRFFPQAQYEEIAGTGHLLPLEVPAELSAAIQKSATG